MPVITTLSCLVAVVVVVVVAVVAAAEGLCREKVVLSNLYLSGFVLFAASRLQCDQMTKIAMVAQTFAKCYSYNVTHFNLSMF